MGLFKTTFPIDASPARVWEVLTDFGSYPDWNPSLPRIEGELRPGETVSLTLGMPGRPSANVKATLDEVEPERLITWDGNVGADWIFSGHRELAIADRGDGTVDFTHIEDIGGALYPLFRLAMGSAIQRSHDEFNAALKRRAENPT